MQDHSTHLWYKAGSEGAEQGCGGTVVVRQGGTGHAGSLNSPVVQGRVSRG